MKKVTLLLIALFLLSTAFYCRKRNADKEKMAGEDTTTSTEKAQALSEDSLPSANEFVPYDEAPKPLKMMEPIYPDSAKKAGIEGEVWIKALIDRQGKVRDVECLRDSSDKPDIFCEPATKAALQYEYKPALSAGNPVAVWVKYKVKFSLK
jgi:TonB family protein